MKCLKFLGISVQWTSVSHKERSCTDKVRYGHRETAQRAITGQARRIKLYSYQCCYFLERNRTHRRKYRSTDAG